MIYNIPGEAAEIPVPTPAVGHVIVLALRNLQRNRAKLGVNKELRTP